LAIEDSENGEEQVDDIELEADSSCNFLLNVVVSHVELSVHKNISGEDQSSESAIGSLLRALDHLSMLLPLLCQAKLLVVDVRLQSDLGIAF